MKKLIERAAESREDEQRARIARILAFGLLLLAGVDVVSTNIAISLGHLEANPIVKFLMMKFDDDWVIPKMIIHWIFAVFIIWLPTDKMIRLSIISIIGYSFICGNNLYISYSSIAQI